MGKYIKLFATHAAYAAYIGGGEAILPNVSYCEDNNDVHYNPWTDPRVIAKFNIEDETESVLLYGADYGVIASDLYSKIEIDGEEISISDLEGDGGYYTFDTTGEHTVKYTLLDPEVIDEGAFNECTGLTSITIPNSVTSIGNNSFYGCSDLTSVRIGNSVTTIGDSAFEGCDNLTSITIPDSVTTIGDSAFYGCTGLTSITIPNSVTTIGVFAFAQCTGLTSVTIGNGVTTIGSNAFQNCTGLTSITIPNSVTTIGNGAFEYCSGLTSVTVQATTPPTLDSSAFTNNASGRKIYVPSESVTAYKAASGWSTYSADIEAIPTT